MIKLYDKSTTNFENNGLGILRDVLICTVEEELNSSYILTLEYPSRGFLSESLITGNIIKAPCGHVSGNDQLFRIKVVSNTLTKKTITAYHIFYDLADFFLEDVYPQNQNGIGALNWMLANTTSPNAFTSFSDIPEAAAARYVKKNVVDALMGTENSFLNTWGGELVRDNFLVKFLQARGQDRGVKIRYGKNITEIKWDIDENGVYTRLYPKGYDGLDIPEKYIDSPLIGIYSNIKNRDYEFSSIKIDIENSITETMAQQQLRDAVQNLYAGGIDKPAVSISVNFVELSKVQEYYELYSSFESIYLGDTVQAIIPYMGLSLSLKIVKTTYNCLSKIYESFEIGNVKENYVTSVLNKVLEIIKFNDINSTNILTSAKENATNQITNALGGYVYKTQNELFIMDTNNITTAQKIWRWNQGGLGYSSTGVNGTYGIAITADGQIVADFITSGQMSTSRITGLDGKLVSIDLGISSITSSVSNVETLINNDYLTAEQVNAMQGTNVDNINLLKSQQAQQVLTAQGLEVSINNIINNGVSTLDNTTVTIDINGITVGKTGSEFKTTMNNTGTTMYSYDKQIAKYDKDGASTYNLTVQNEAILGNLRIMSYTISGEKRTHIHWIG